MKMPTMNFDFGPFTESGVVALSPYGIAVRSSKGEYLTYVDVTGFTFDFQKMPAAIKDLRAGDMVLHRGKPMYVQSVEEDGIHCINQRAYAVLRMSTKRKNILREQEEY